MSKITKPVFLDVTGQRIAEAMEVIAVLEGAQYTGGIVDYDSLKRLIKKTHVYGMRWDQTNANGTRLFDAANITTDTTNFCYRGTFGMLDNPFDKLYPFSDFKQCNVDLDAYRALGDGEDIRNAIVAWYGDPDFRDDGSNGFVGAYRPGYWYTAYEDGESIVFAVSDGQLPGFTYSPPYIRGYGHCVDAGNNKVTCYNANPLTNIAVGTIHTYAKNSGFAIEDIYTYSAEITALVVEYCTMNTQNAIGSGAGLLYRASESDIPLIAENNANRVILPAAAAAYCVEGATLDFAGSKDGVTIANRRICTGYSVYSGNADYIEVTFKGDPLNITTSMFVSFHGAWNGPAIGNESGYIGTNGKVNSFYRGAALFSNRLRYTLGIYSHTGDNHVWLCPPDKDPNDYDALNTTDHIDTGLTLALTQGYIKRLALIPGLGAVPVCLEVGGNGSNPVGDYHYINTDGGNTILVVGGYANDGQHGGAFYGYWDSTLSHSFWALAVVPVLK